MMCFFGRSIMKYTVTSFLALFLISGVAACGTGITRDALLWQMQGENAPLIVDVRSQREYDRDHLPGAVHIPFFVIESGLQQAGFSKKDPVVLYCEHGPRAGIAGFSLFLSGYEQVYSLEGHMSGWRSHDYPVEIKKY
jgi:rhodanese-related sulfurtransferase